MKKLLVILLVLATFLTSTGFLSFLGIGSRTITDPVLTAFEGRSMPAADYMSPLGDGRALTTFTMKSGHSYTCAQSVYDAEADRSYPITMRPQDAGAWDAIIRDAISQKTSKDYSLYLLLLETEGPAALLQYEQLRVYSVGDRYAYCAASLYDALLDCRTGELLPLDPALEVSYITPWDELLRCDYRENSVRFSLMDLQGNVLHTAEVDVGECIFPGIVPMADGLAVLCSGTFNRTEASVITCTLLDKELSIARKLTLSENLPINRISDIVRAAQTGHLLVSTSCGLLVIPPEGGETLLIGEGRDEMSAVTTTLPSDHLNSADKSYNMIHVIGFAKDGSCALLSTKSSGLYKLDMNTLTLTRQMTQTELDWYDLILSDMMGMRWDGSDVAVYPRGVMRIQDR